MRHVTVMFARPKRRWTRLLKQTEVNILNMLVQTKLEWSADGVFIGDFQILCFCFGGERCVCGRKVCVHVMCGRGRLTEASSVQGKALI